MKKVYSIILTALVALAFAPAVSAQYSIDDFIKGKYGDDATIVFHNDDTKLDTEKNFGYSKGISSPFDDGSYWIKLESFATGSAEQEVKPADIVLVLDLSGSMNAYYGPTGNHYELVAENSYTYNSSAFLDNATAANQRYYYYGGKYYRVKRGQTDSGETFTTPGGTVVTKYWQYLYIDTDDGKRYLDDMSLVKTEPHKYSNDPNDGKGGSNAKIWNGSLFKSQNYTDTGTSTSGTIPGTRWHRLRELKTAVAGFIDIMYRNDNEFGTMLGNRISIVTYQGSTASTLLGGWVNVTQNNGSRDETLLKELASKTASGYTPVEVGMQRASTLLSQLESSRKSNRTVVLFTDGLPHSGTTDWSDNTNLATAIDCIQAAYTAKHSYGATVFSVSIWPGNYTSDGGKKMMKYLECTSSNYPDANPADGAGADYATGLRCDSEERPESERKPAVYTKTPADDLASVFADIASMSGGSGANLTSASSTVDIISHSFKFPDNFDASQVKVFTAKLNHIDNLGEANEEYVFDEEILAGHSPDKYKVYHPATGAYIGEYFVDEHEGPDNHDDGLPAEIVTVQGEPGIKVTNFDYKNNWCGPVKDKDGNVSYYTGHKIIILIPIQMNPDAVGGPNVETNGDHSGVYLNNGQSYVEFKSPTVSLPVNIYIEKAGLVGVESAKFLIERAVLPDLQPGQDEYTAAQIANLTNWEYVTSVYVTNSNNYPHDATSGNPLVKVKGLPATKLVNGVQKGLVYRVSEEDWSWSYNKTGAKYQYTITGQSNNPFTFTNSKKTGIDQTVKHAESKVTNIFKLGVTNEVYDDSKTNTRTSGTNTNP